MRTVLFLLLATTFGGVAMGATPAFIPPHNEQLAPGVYAAGFAHRFDDANCGWVALRDHTLLIDLPRGVELRPFLDYVQQVSGKPVTKVVTTSMRAGDDKLIESLARAGVKKVAVPSVKSRAQIGDDAVVVEVLPYGNVAGLAGNAVFLPQSGVMFSGPAVINGPRTKLPGTKTAAWLKELTKLESLKPTKVVPGSGSWGGDKVLERQRRFLTELRNQVGYGIAKGRSIENIAADVRLPFSCYVWMPYDLPTFDDIKHVYGELTAPYAPFGDDPPSKLDGRAHALVLIGDRMHEPEHAERGLRPVFDAANVVPHFTVDYRALNARNLAKVSLLVIQRDGMLWPDGDDKPYRAWMQPDQEADVVDFVNKGGGFLCLHNSMGLFPENGPYLRLVGGHYTGHGPLERFSVSVVDRNHPITRDVEDYFVADEQHTPVMDNTLGHVLLMSRSDDGVTAPAGWEFEPGKGRLVHLANGHTRDALNHPAFQQLMRNSVRWLVRQP